MTSLQEVMLAGLAAAWGVDYTRLLTVRDPLERLLEANIILDGVKLRQQAEEANATRVGNAVAKALGG